MILAAFVAVMAPLIVELVTDRAAPVRTVTAPLTRQVVPLATTSGPFARRWSWSCRSRPGRRRRARPPVPAVDLPGVPRVADRGSTDTGTRGAGSPAPAAGLAESPLGFGTCPVCSG